MTKPWLEVHLDQLPGDAAKADQAANDITERVRTPLAATLAAVKGKEGNDEAGKSFAAGLPNTDNLLSALDGMSQSLTSSAKLLNETAAMYKHQEAEIAAYLKSLGSSR
jgi:hypothetical protein